MSDTPDWLGYTLSNFLSLGVGFAAGWMARGTSSGESPSETVNPDSQEPDLDAFRQALDDRLRDIRDQPTRERVRRLVDRAVREAESGRGSGDGLLQPDWGGGGEGE